MSPRTSTFRARPPGLAALLLVGGLFTSIHALQAQRASRAQAGARPPMAAFLRALRDERRQDTTRRWFPTSGAWSYTHVVHHPGGRTVVGRWIVPAAQTSLLFGFGKGTGPTLVDHAFEVDYHGQREGFLIEVAMRTPDRWRRVAGNRFVPPGTPASSPVFVQWRREGGRWVISAFGDEHFCARRRVGEEIGPIMRTRRRPEPPRPVFAAREPWYERSEALRYDSRRYLKYGQPRDIQPRDLEPFAWYGDVRIHVEGGHAAEPWVFYVPTAPDVYQPYVTEQADDHLCP